MLKFSILGIPVGVDWWFWLMCILLGGGFYAKAPEDWHRVAVWTAVVFVSIMVHELGHALAARRFGVKPLIKLHGFGGVTFLPGADFDRPRSIAVSFAGPAAGFLLGGIFLLFDALVSPAAPLVALAVRYGLFVNFFWTLINLLPIQPLDGGQILRDVLGPRRIQITSWIGCVLAAGLCIVAIRMGMLFLAFMLAVLAYHNFQRQPVAGGVIKG